MILIILNRINRCMTIILNYFNNVCIYTIFLKVLPNFAFRY